MFIYNRFNYYTQEENELKLKKFRIKLVRTILLNRENTLYLKIYKKYFRN